MTREQAKDYAKSKTEEFLRQYCGVEDTRHNFRCLNPEHSDANPSMSYDRRRQCVHCFGCGVDWDIFDLAGVMYGLHDKAEQFGKVYELLGISINEEQPRQTAARSGIGAYIASTQLHIADKPAADYLTSRGISLKTAQRFGLGFDEAFKAFPAIIIPTAKNAYTARNINPSDKENRIRKQGQSGLFNASALTCPGTVFVVEGEFDALSIEECGHAAVSLGSVSNTRKLTEAVKKLGNVESRVLCLALDNDDAGREATDKLRKELGEAGIPFAVSDIAGVCKDANERLVKDRQGLEQALTEAEALKPEQIGNALKIISAAELFAKDLPPVRFIVDDILPQGLAILASPPKYGKSWFVLDLCIAVATGIPFMSFNTHKSGALYLALEDSETRLKERLLKLTENEPPSGLYLTTQAQTLAGGLIEQLERQIKETPDIRLIVIDTLQKVRNKASKTDTAYGHDYAEVGALKAFADKYGICVLLVHHLRKMSDDSDVFNRISGTAGISGAADTMLALARKKRSDDETTLSITGRDVEMNDFLVTFDKSLCRWRLIGDSEEEQERREIAAYKNDPIVQTIKYLLEPHGFWRGTTTEVMNACMEHTGKYEIDLTTPRKMSLHIRKLQKPLFEIDKITYTPPSPNGGAGGRIHTFKDTTRYTLYN